jgi:hypothetical protein
MYERIERVIVERTDESLEPTNNSDFVAAANFDEAPKPANGQSPCQAD